MKARAELQSARAERNRIMDGLEAISVMRETEEPRPAYILNRGSYDARGEEVTANTPSALAAFPEDQPRNRLGLARWLTDPDHSLTARVAVNRYWQMIFGVGLVRTPEDFGSQGSNPTHPELLDWLARDFVNHSWDLHRLLRQMVLSATYRKAPLAIWITWTENQPFAEQLEPTSGEMIRDNTLAVSGLLVDDIGGPPVKPYEVTASFKPMEQTRRRIVPKLTVWANSPAPMMVTLTLETGCMKFETQAVSPAALVILNDRLSKQPACWREALANIAVIEQRLLKMPFTILRAESLIPKKWRFSLISTKRSTRNSMLIQQTPMPYWKWGTPRYRFTKTRESMRPPLS